MTAEEKQKIRRIIQSQIAEIEEKLKEETGEKDPIAPDVSIGRLSRLDSMQMQQMALNAERRQEEQLQKLKEAIQRIDKNTYGKCVFCRQEIPFPRLEVQPDAIACVNCAH